MIKHQGGETGRGSRILYGACLTLAFFVLTACSSFAPTAWIGPDTPEDVGEGAFPKLSDIPERPVPPESAGERGQIAADLAAERDRLEREAKKLREGDEDTGNEEPDGT